MRALLLTALRKVGFFLAVLLGVSFAIITLARFVPGDAIDQLSDDTAFRAAMVAELGLDQSLLEQYFAFWGKLLQGDLGQSWVLRQGDPVIGLIGPAFSKSLTLILPALGLSFGLASLLLFFFAWDGFRGLKSPVRFFAHACSVLPLFLLGDLLVLGVNGYVYRLVEAGSLERPLWFALPGEEHWFKYLLAVIVLAVGNGTLSDVVLHLDEEVRKVSHQEFILSSRIRGAWASRHMALNLLVPVATLLVNKIAFFVGGVVVVETVFNINGMGAMIWRAANSRDVPVVIGITFVIAAGMATLHLVTDLIQVIIDPRVRS